MVTGRPLSPAKDAAIGLVLRVLVRRPARSVKHQFRAHEANAVANRGIDPFELVGAGGVEVHGDRGSVLRDRRPLTEGRRCGGCDLCAASPRGEGGAGVLRGIQHHFAARGVDQRLAAGHPVGGGAESHDHRHAAGAREHRDVAGRAALRQHNGAALRPVDAEKARERQVGRDHHRAAGNRRAVRRRRQMPEHAVADVLEIGCASGEIGILGGAITGDFVGHCGLPRRGRRLAG